MEHLAVGPRITEQGVPIDETIIKLNYAIAQLLKKYIPEACDIRFDLPMEEPGCPTISVFLYDIQEDVQMRSGDRRTYIKGSPGYEPGCAHVQCFYRITYWAQKQGSGGDTNAAQPNSQAIVIINRVLNALLNNRELPTIASSYSRIMAPSDGLNTLGNFWQAMDNKPKLSISYAVTVPIQLYGREDEGSMSPVQTTEIQMGQSVDPHVLKRAERELTIKLLSALTQSARTQVGMQVKLTLQPITKEGLLGVEVALSGRVSKEAHEEVMKELNNWTQSEKAVEELSILAWRWHDMAPVMRDPVTDASLLHDHPPAKPASEPV